jgi:hypothetical protein
MKNKFTPAQITMIGDHKDRGQVRWSKGGEGGGRNGERRKKGEQEEMGKGGGRKGEGGRGGGIRSP